MPSLVEENARRRELTEALNAAGAEWDSVYGAYQMPDGTTLQSVAGGEWRVFPPGKSLWSTNRDGVERHADFESAARSVLSEKI